MLKFGYVFRFSITLRKWLKVSCASFSPKYTQFALNEKLWRDNVTNFELLNDETMFLAIPKQTFPESDQYMCYSRGGRGSSTDETFQWIISSLRSKM